MVTTTPKISDFVLYAERSISLGTHDTVFRGDIGVHSIAESSFGVQLKVGTDSILEKSHTVFSPSVSLGRDVRVGTVRTNVLQDNGIRLGSPVVFPAQVMPPLPLAPAPAISGESVMVEANQVLELPPGNYDALTVFGRLVLKSGHYVFSSATLADFAQLVAIADDVHISIRDYLTAGRSVTISPAFRKAADQLTISVSGSNEAGGQPTVSLGEHSEIRALLAVPHGRISIADHVRATGAFAGFDLILGEEVNVDFESGFPIDAAGQQGSQQLQGYYGVHPDPSVAPLVGPIPANTNISLAIGLPARDPQGLKTFIKQVSDPKHPNFRKHLTQAEFYATYGATTSDYQSLQDWASANGFTINTTFPNNLLLSVSGTAAQIEQALFVNLVYRLRKDGSKFVAVDRDPSLNLTVPILEINGLTDFVLPHSAVSVNSTGTVGYRAADLRNAYLGVGSDCQSLDGTGQVVGIVDFATFNLADIKGYDALQLPVEGQPPLPPTNVVIVAMEGGNPVTGSTLESTLDIELVHAMAPNAEILFFQGNAGITGHLDDILHAMATSTPPLTVASCSLGFGRSDNSQQALDEMAAQGVSFFTASGDFGDIGDPQDNLDMDNQILVGGTFLLTNPLISPLPHPVYPHNYYAGETTWNQHPAPKSNGVTGGGVMDGNNKIGGDVPGISIPGCSCWPYPSCCGSGVPIPDYQVATMQIGIPTSGGPGGSTVWRNYPDVAMLADNIEAFFEGGVVTVAGTSCAAPLWAGFMALVNQKSLQNGGGKMGFINPTLYDIGLTRGSVDDLYSVCFHDVQDGISNANGFGSGFKSVPGYDLTTGWGTPTCALIHQLASPTPLTSNQPLALIRFVIKTGEDDLGGGLHGSSATADVFLPGGGSFPVTLRNSNEANWDRGSTHTVDFSIPNTVRPPLTRTRGIKGVRINLIQDNPDFSADNWDIVSLSVSLFNPDGPQICQINLIGTSHLEDGSIGLVRLSKSPGSSGSGPVSPIYSTGPTPVSGCP